MTCRSGGPDSVWLCAVVDPGNLIAEKDETNNASYFKPYILRE
ncbi:hypothetical protein FJY71_04735 [candidate division WOR-3 bacterium]|nr:hypothetical protein [candidate division WOR-3 bacterium]